METQFEQCWVATAEEVAVSADAKLKTVMWMSPKLQETTPVISPQSQDLALEQSHQRLSFPRQKTRLGLVQALAARRDRPKVVPKHEKAEEEGASPSYQRQFAFHQYLMP